MGGQYPPTDIFQWVWTLKDEVTKTLRRISRQDTPPSIPLLILQKRYEFHCGPSGGSGGESTGLVDDVALGDVLVIIALHSTLPSRQREDVFMEFCEALVQLLPVAPDAEILKGMKSLDASTKSRLLSSVHAISVRARVGEIEELAEALQTILLITIHGGNGNDLSRLLPK